MGAVTDVSTGKATVVPVRTLPGGPELTGQRLMAAVSANSNGEELVRRAAGLAKRLNYPWIALYVEAPDPPGETEHLRITQTLALARQLGAEVITTTDTDVVRSLLRVASQRHVTQIIIGKPPAPFWRIFQRDRALRRLARESGGVDIHVVSATEEEARSFRRWRILNESTWSQYWIAIGVVVAVTAAAVLMRPLIGPPYGAALVFLLGVVVLGSFVGRGPTLLAALMSALLWDYFILPPIYQFRIAHEDVFVFGMYFIVALIMGQLTTRIRAQQEIERLGEERATALYLLTRELTGAANPDQIVRRAVRQMERVFDARIAVLLSGEPDGLQPQPHPASTFKPTEEGGLAAAWVLAHQQAAGRFTGNLTSADAFYAPLATSEGMAGVIGLQLSQSFPPTVHQLNLLDAFLGQIGVALDHHRLNQISERARVLAESERLTRTLLDSMSHEVRTPIAAITSATSTLVELEKADAHPLHKEMIGEIQEATGRLNRLVGNFLEVSRLESGAVKPSLNECDASDLVYTALAETEKELSRHAVKIEVAPGLPLVRMDFVLMQQALTNLLSNAALHTPAGTLIEVSARIEYDGLSIVVADGGPGIPTASMAHIFDKFYRAPNAPDGGTGLGLSLVKGFMEAQGGQAKAENRSEGGAKFTLLLPLAGRCLSAEPTS
jgi:two-component system sensor histidine kinase KdpD